MADDRLRGSCLIADCPRDPYPREDSRVPLVCGVDESRLRHWLREIPLFVAELSGGGLVMRDRIGDDWLLPDEAGRSQRQPVGSYGPAPARLAAREPDHPLVQRAGQPVEHRDLVAHVLPVGPIGAPGRGGRVSGSAEPRLPINVDRTDLLAAARTATSASAPLAYPEQDGDQVGFLPVAATLDGLAEGLRLHRRAGERRPLPAVTSLCAWLLERLSDACDDWPGIGEFFDEVRLAHGALRAQLGLIDIPDYKAGIPCSKCGHLTLLRHHGEDTVVCASCPYYMTIPEYERYVTTLSAEAVAARKKAAVERRAVVRLLREMHAVGWRHSVSHLVHRDPDTGAPDVEATSHGWRRGQEQIELCLWADSNGADLRYALLGEGSDGWIGPMWLASMGTRRLHALATAAGVLSVLKERG